MCVIRNLSKVDSVALLFYDEEEHEQNERLQKRILKSESDILSLNVKRSTEDVSPPNFSERNSGYYERNSRLASESSSYLRRSNSNSYQSSSSNNTSKSSTNSSNSKSSVTNSENRSRTRDRLYRNGPNALSVSPATISSAPALLSERTSIGASNKVNNSRVPPTSWYEAAATYTNGPGGSGNADVSAANSNQYQTAASKDLPAAATTNSTSTSSYTGYSLSSSPAHNNSNTKSTATLLPRPSTFYRHVPIASGVQTHSDKELETNLSTTPPLLNKNKQKLIKSSTYRSSSSSPTSTTLITGGLGGASTTMTSSAPTTTSTSAPTSLSSSSTNTINNSRNNQTANNSCSSVSSTINSSNENSSISGNNNNLSNTDNSYSGNSKSSGILNAAALVAVASKREPSSIINHKSNCNSGNVTSSISNISAPKNAASNNQSTSASIFHGRSTTSSSRSHSRSPSSYSSSHSSSSSSSSTSSSHSHACSPVGSRDLESSTAHLTGSRPVSRSLQSAVAVPGTSSTLNPTNSNLCGSSSSSTSSTSSGTPTCNPFVHSEDNLPLAIRVRNLPARSSDTSLKDGLFHEYKKHGKVTWVKVVGQNAERYALVCFKKPEDVEKALEISHDKLFFGCKIEVEPYQGYDVEDNEFRPYEAELDEYHPKSTRTLFIGNLEKEITSSELRQHFECFGEIIEIDIKKQGMSAYAFCQYSDIVSVVKAMRKMDGEHLGNNRIKLGFGKSMPTNCVWIDGIGEKISESHLQSQFLRYGAVSKVVVDRQRQLALVLYEQIQYAQTAVKEMRGATLRGRKLQVDFASRECQDAFYEKLEKQSTGSRFTRYESQSRSRASSFSRHQNSNDGCSPSNTPGSSSSSSGGVLPPAPTLSSAIVAGSSALSVSNPMSGNNIASVVGQSTGNTTPVRSRGSRTSRQTLDYEYLDTRRFRSCDEYSQGSATSHDEDNSSTNHTSSNTNVYSGLGLRSDSPLLSRLGPIVTSSAKETGSEVAEMCLSRRRCDKSPAKQKGDIRFFQKERAVLLEQLEECPSSGDENVMSPRKRVKIDHHSVTYTYGLTQSHSLDEQQQHKNANCDYLLNDPTHRKSETRRMSECNSSLNKYLTPQQNHHHSHHGVQPASHHHHQQQQISRRPSIDLIATSSGVGSSLSNTRHNSTSSSNSDHHTMPHQSSSSSLACKRRRMIGTGCNAITSTTSLLSTSGGGSLNLPMSTNDDCHYHSSRGRGHQLHSHHSHEASGGESADGSRPGTPLCDERPEVLPTEPRRVPRERPREAMLLPLPKFGVLFFQQYRNSSTAANMHSYHHHHHLGVSYTNSASNSNSGSTSHLVSNSTLNRGDIGVSGTNSHSSLSHSSVTTVPLSAPTSSGNCYLPSPSSRFPPHWRPHHHNHQQHSGALHGLSGGATPSSSSSMLSPLRSRSLSSNSSDSDVPGQTSGSPSLEERIRTLDEMYERWSGSSSSSNIAGVPNVLKRHDFNNAPPTWQQHRSNLQAELYSSSNCDTRSNAIAPTPATRHKFLDIDVHEMQPSDIVKSVLAKKSIFDDDLQRLKKNHWYEPSPDTAHILKAAIGCTASPALPNLQPTKSPVVGCNISQTSATSSSNKPTGTLLQRLASISPMNSPQTSMSPYNSPSNSPSVIPNNVPLTTNVIMGKVISTSSCTVSVPQVAAGTIAVSTSPASSGATKCLQYPFPTHPPLPNTAAPIQNAQPLPPPPAETSKFPMVQPPLPPMEVSQPPQPPALSPRSSSTGAGSSTKPKTSALSKSLSVPPPPKTAAMTESRIFTKSVSVPGSTNLGTVKTTDSSLIYRSQIEHNQPQQKATGNSSLHSSKSHFKEDDLIGKPSGHMPSPTVTETLIKRSEKLHKHNYREEKKSSKNDRRKNTNGSQLHLIQTSAAELSDADENDNKTDRKERPEKREKEVRKQQERQEREIKEKEHEVQEQKANEVLEKERREIETLERECIEKKEREHVQTEKERKRKEEELRIKEDRENKTKEEREYKLNDQRERDDNEKIEREEIERREREMREELLRKEKKARQEHEQKEKEKIDRQRMREEKGRENKTQEENNSEGRCDVNLLKEHQRRKENVASQIQMKSGNDSIAGASQTARDFSSLGEIDKQNNKENSTAEICGTLDTASTSNSKHKNRKTSRNTSPVRHPKRRFSVQDDNASNSIAANTHAEEYGKRIRMDPQQEVNQPQTANCEVNDKRESKEHHSKDRNYKHNRAEIITHKANVASSVEKEHNTKHHRNRHHHKSQPNPCEVETNDNIVAKCESEVSNSTSKYDHGHTNTNHSLDLKPKVSPALTSDDEEPPDNTNTSTPCNNKSVSAPYKHRDHGCGHHNRHKSNKREREHHRDKKKHSSSASTVRESAPSTSPSVIDEVVVDCSENQMSSKRILGHNIMFDLNAKNKNDVSDSKISHCAEDRIVAQPHTPSHRQNNLNKNLSQSSTKRVLHSSAEDTDGGCGVIGITPEDEDSDNRQRSIFDIPDDGPYISMYDKVKARSCKNMQKQEEEKKIKAKFSQLKQSRAKREEKKRSTSYDGDSDSDFDRGNNEHQKQHNRSSSSYKMHTGRLSSSEDERPIEGYCQNPTGNKRRSSQASSSAPLIHPNRLCSDSDDSAVTQRRIKLQDNLRRLCDDGDDTSEDDLIRRHNTGFTSKRLLHHTSRIASDSESQSQSAVDMKLKQEPIETSNDDNILPVFKNKIKKEVSIIESTRDISDSEFKFKALSTICSSIDDNITTPHKIKSEKPEELLSVNEIKRELKDYYSEENLQPEQKFHKSPSTVQVCSPEQTKIKKHKKSKKRQKTPTHNSLDKEQSVSDSLIKNSEANTIPLFTTTSETKNSKSLASPCFDAFDELKRGEILVTHSAAELEISVEKKRHKDRKEKKREKQRQISADIGSGAEMDKIVYEKEKHRLKKSKKSKSLDVMHQSITAIAINQDQSATPVQASSVNQHKQRTGGEKMEDIFGPISDEDEELTDSDIGGRDLNCILNRTTSSSNVPGPTVSAALNPYKQEPLTPKSHALEENDENKPKLPSSTVIGTSPHLERAAERHHRKEKREKKRRDREKSRSSEHNQSIGCIPSPDLSTAKLMDDENSVDLDAAGRALEAQLMDDSDNKTVEEAIPTTVNTYRSDMADVFLFSDCDENSLDLSSNNNKHDKKETEKEQTSNMGSRIKEKKKKKKRSKEEKQIHHQRRECPSSNASQLAIGMVTSISSTSKLTIDIQAATKLVQKTSEDHMSVSSSTLCKPSPSLPCLIGDDDDANITIQGSTSTPSATLNSVTTSVCTTPHRSSPKDMRALSPHRKEKQIISPIPKTPTIRKINSDLNISDKMNKNETTTPTIPTSLIVRESNKTNTSTSSGNDPPKNVNKTMDSSSASNVIELSTSVMHSSHQKKKSEIFIPGFDGEIDDQISESAVKSISTDFNTPLDSIVDEPKMLMESPSDALKLDKLSESKSRVTISQEETESAVSALLGESFGNSTTTYNFNDDDDGLGGLNNTIPDTEHVMPPGEADEEAALAAKAIECEVESSAITDTVEDDSEEVSKAIQSLKQDELDVKADTPQSVRDLQIDTDTEENVDEADSSGSNSLKIDETIKSNNSSVTSEKSNVAILQSEGEIVPISEISKINQVSNSSVITKVQSSKSHTISSTTKNSKLEPPIITERNHPSVQPTKDIEQPVIAEVSKLPYIVTSSSLSTSAMPTTMSAVTMSYTSTPIKTSLASNSTNSSPAIQTKNIIPSCKPFASSASDVPAGYQIQPPTITIPEPATHFVVPQLILSPRGVVTNSHLNDSSMSSSSTTHSPGSNHMAPQSSVGSAYLMGVRAQSPHSPRQHTSRCNTPTPRQPSPHTPTPTPPPITVTPHQQQNLFIQRTMQHQQKLVSPPGQGQTSNSNSSLTSPVMQHRQLGQTLPLHTVTQQQQSPTSAPEQRTIQINNYSTPPSQPVNIANIRVATPSHQQHGQQSSQQQSVAKNTLESQQHVPIGQHILPISVQKMPPVPTHPTIISKVVTVTPQQAQQSPAPGGNVFPSTIGGSPARHQIVQQVSGKPNQKQQQAPQLQFIQQQQRQQHHMLQLQQQQTQQNFVIHQRNLATTQQTQQQSQNTQQMKVQYHQHQQPILALTQQTSTQQQNISQSSSIPQRFLVQQHIIGMAQHQTQQQQQPQPQQQQPQQQQPQQQQPQQQQSPQISQHPQLPNSPQSQNTQHNKAQQSPIYSPKQQQAQQQYHQLQHRQQSSSPQRILQQPESAKESPRVIITTNQPCKQNDQTTSTATASIGTVEKASSLSTHLTSANTKVEGVSVISIPTPISVAATSSTASKTLSQNSTATSTNKESPTTPSVLNISRTVPLTEENVIKISATKHDEQDSKEDSDYWSAKELNVIETNNASNLNTNAKSTVIIKNESLSTPEMSVPVSATTSSTLNREQGVDEIKCDPIDDNTNNVKSNQSTKNDDQYNSPLDSNSGNTGTSCCYSQSGNVTTDHETEDETETQQMPTFEQVPVQGKSSTRGTGAKRGRQPRGGKKTPTPISTHVNTQQVHIDLGSTAGVQTRLRKPNLIMSVTRGRKGRPPRNLLLQQQLQQQPHDHLMSTTQTSNANTSVLALPLCTTAAEKKSRNQVTTSSATLGSLSEGSQQQHQDVYEFHDESGDESKTTSIPTATTSTSVNSDRPRLILTIKSPAPGSTPLVKASEKTVSKESSSTKPSTEQTTGDLAQDGEVKLEATIAELTAAANIRKSRRLLEKDRSTIDDIIEDVIRNTATNVIAGNTVTTSVGATSTVPNVSPNALPKGAQTPPRRSGRNSSQNKSLKPTDTIPSSAATPIGRHKKPKDRKNTNEFETEQTISSPIKHLVNEGGDVDITKSVNNTSEIETSATQVTHSQLTQVACSSTNIPVITAQQQVPQQHINALSSSIPQHPKKKALAAAEIESYQTSTTPTSSTAAPNIHSALPAVGAPILNTAAPASQKTTGGAADSIIKPLMDPVTGIVSGSQMERAKEGNLPSATAASQPMRAPTDPKKMIQAAAAAAAAENISLNSKLQCQPSLTGSVATPITALTKPLHIEATAAQVTTSTPSASMLNKSVSVVVKSTTLPPTSSPPSSAAVVQQQQHLQQRQDLVMPTKQPIILQQHNSSAMHAQHTNIRPPTSLKAHVLNSQKLQQQQCTQQQYTKQQLPQQQSHQVSPHQAPTTQSGSTHQISSYVLQNSIVQRQTTTAVASSTAPTQQQQQFTATKQLLVNIPPTSAHSGHTTLNTLNSPRHLQQHTQQQTQPLGAQHSLVIKQAHDIHSAQVLHVVSSKTSSPSLGGNKSVPSTVHPPPSIGSAHSSYASYIQTSGGSLSKQQLPQQPVVIHQQTLGVQSKPSATSLVMPPGILGVATHPAMVIQTKTSVPSHSPSSSATAVPHLQHTNHHTPSPPLQPTAPHLAKTSNTSMIHSVQHNLNAIASPASPSSVKSNPPQSTIVSNTGASSLRTAIPTMSPQSQARMGSILLPGSMQVPPHFETSMHDIATYASSVTSSVLTAQSPPPAHQQASPITPSEASFAGGMGRVGVQGRENAMIYQHLLRQHDSMNLATLREFDEKLLAGNPALELRRPGSVPRTVAVPHSLQSPQDRSTDSPQVAQVYVHNTRIPAHSHYDVTSRPGAPAQSSAYYDATRKINLEPPPAHRSAPVLSTVGPPPPTVVVPLHTSGSTSPFMAAVPSGASVQAPPSSATPGHHSKSLERDREHRERDREQQMLREKEQIMTRTGAESHNMQVATPPPHQPSSSSHQLPPHAQQPLPQADSLLTLLQRYPVMWQGLLALKTDQAAVQMHFVFGNPRVARASLPCNDDGSTPPLRIAQRMRLEQTQLEGVAKKMQFENEHCMLLALPCGRDHADVLQQSRNLQSGFITYLQQKMAAGIVNIPMPGSEQAAYVVHIFPSCDFANENLEKAAPDLKNRVADIAHLLIVIATV